MKQDIEDHITLCSECIQTKPEKPIKISQIIETIRPLYRFIADLYQIPEKLCEAAAIKGHIKYKYVLMCLDHFSKYLWGTLIENKEGSTIIKELELIFNQFGDPKLFHSDNGKEFRNKMLKEFCDHRNIKMRQGRPFHPRSQGAVERLNHFVGESLSLAFQNFQAKKKDDERFEMENVLKAFVNNHNKNVHTVTGYRPINLVLMEDENQIEQVNSKIKAYYEKKNLRISQRSLKVGMKVYIVGDIMIGQGNKLVLSKEAVKKNSFKKKRKEKIIKIAAEITDITNIKVNKIEVKIRGGRLLENMQKDKLYVTEPSFLAIAKENQWNRLLKL